jgi:hypothetical protein
MSTQLVSPLTTGPLVFETPARAMLPSPQASSPLPIMTTPRTEGLDQGDQYLHAMTKQIHTTIVDDPAAQGPEATQASTSGTRTGPTPPPRPRIDPASSSSEWSGIESDEDTSAFVVDPSKAISTSPPEPPPQQD